LNIGEAGDSSDMFKFYVKHNKARHEMTGKSLKFLGEIGESPDMFTFLVPAQ